MSFTLRTFTETSEVNNYLGDQYEIVYREQNYNRFNELYLDRFGRNHVSDSDPSASEESIRTYAIVVNSKEESIPIFKNQKNYIVTSGGKTFANLTYK